MRDRFFRCLQVAEPLQFFTPRRLRFLGDRAFQSLIDGSHGILDRIHNTATSTHGSKGGLI